MKNFKKISIGLKSFIALIMLCFLQTMSFAQDGGGSGGGKVDVSITKSNSNWYAQPWVWIIGGAVFILLLVALMRSNNSNRD